MSIPIEQSAGQPPLSAKCATRAPGTGVSWLLVVLVVFMAESVMAAPTPSPSVHIYEVNQDGKPAFLVSLLPIEHVQSHGLHESAIVGSLLIGPRDGGEVDPSNFRANPAFVDFLQAFIGRAGPGDPAFERAARAQGNGWIYVIDRRTPTPMGDVPAEDIFGGFEVRGGVLVPGSWTPMKSHRLVTQRGLFRLDGFLHPRLMDALRSLPPTLDPAGKASR